MKIYIGFDRSQSLAAAVCKYSLELQAATSIQFIELTKVASLTGLQFGVGSTEFAITRFLVPYLNNYTGMALFVDCDFLFLANPDELAAIVTKQDFAVGCVQHQPYLPKSDLKMNKQSQTSYARKNWSSLMLFNCEHRDCLALTPEIVATAKPLWLHQFDWTSRIASLPPAWNYLVGYSSVESPKAIHFTDGGPWYEEYRYCEHAESWLRMLDGYNKHLGSGSASEDGRL